MSDTYISDLLHQWGLDDYRETFIREKVDAGCLRILEDSDIKDLIPLAGDRARFKNNLALWKSELTNDTPNCQEGSVPVKVVNIGEIPNENAVSFNENRPDIFVVSDVNETANNKANSVLEFLKSCIDGKAILNSGEKNGGLLDQTLRCRLARLIATKELTNNPTGVVPGSRLMKCAHEIAEIFPKESPTIYYIPYMSATPQQIKRNASGKLYDAVVNRQKDLRKRGIIVGSSRSSKCSDTSSVGSLTESEKTLSSETDENEPELEEKLHWLKNAVDPWHLVEINWVATTNVRLATLQSHTEGSVEEYFNLYPALKQPNGYRLLMQDFDVIHTKNKDYFYSNIILYQKNIISAAKSKIKQIKDIDVKRDMQEII